MGYEPMMRRVAVPVLSLVFVAAFLQAAFADEAPPLEAVWHLGAGIIGDPALPSGLASGSDGSVYVVEVGLNRVQKFDADGRLLERWGAPKGEPGALDKPFGIAVGPDDSVYVTELGGAQVRHFDSHGVDLGAWGRFGTQNGRFREPRGIAVNAEGRVYVVDSGNHRVQCFSAQGRFLNAWGENELASPVDVAVTPQGDVLVTDLGSRSVHRFSADGTPVTSFRPTDGFLAFDFWPQSIAVAANGQVFVADPWSAQILEFSPDGRFLRRWPDPEREPEGSRIVPVKGRAENVPPSRLPAQADERQELKTPLALDVDPSSRLLLIDRGLAQVRIYKP